MGIYGEIRVSMSFSESYSLALQSVMDILGWRLRPLEVASIGAVPESEVSS